MFFLGAGDEPVNAYDPQSIGEYTSEFNMQQEDWMLKQHIIWDSIKSDVFHFRLGKWKFQIPSGVYLFTGCPSGSMDWIISDEIIGREIEIFIMPPSFTSWSLEIPVLESVQHNAKFFAPSTKNPTAMMDNSVYRCIVTSVNDQYHKMKNKYYNTLFVV